MWRRQIIHETKECNTTTYLAVVVADIAVSADGRRRESSCIFVCSRLWLGLAVRAHTHKTDVCNRRFNVWSWAKTDDALEPAACFTRLKSVPAKMGRQRMNDREFNTESR